VRWGFSGCKRGPFGSVGEALRLKAGMKASAAKKPVALPAHRQEQLLSKVRRMLGDGGEPKQGKSPSVASDGDDTSWQLEGEGSVALAIEQCRLAPMKLEGQEANEPELLYTNAGWKSMDCMV